LPETDIAGSVRLPGFHPANPQRPGTGLHHVEGGASDTVDDPVDPVDEDDDAGEDPPAAPSRREGLPSTFRMRSTPHYVEQLFGGAPIETVRQVPLGDLDAPPTADVDVEPLAESIRQLGLLQPLAVARSGGRFRVIAGANRLAAARLAGLTMVPCIVIDAPENQLDTLRQAASHRAPVRTPALEPPVTGTLQTAAPAALLRVAFDEVSRFLACVPLLVPLAEDDADFRSSVVRDLLLVEAQRATTIAAAASLLLETGDDRDPPSGLVDCREVLARVEERIRPAARLKDVRLAWPESPSPAHVRGDRESLLTAWSALLYAYLMVARAGDRLEVSLDLPRIRPAVLFQLSLVRPGSGESDRLAGDVLPMDDRLGVSAAGALVGAARVCARRHGGRFAQEISGDGLRGLFVIPVSLDVADLT
jgi:hypothetical protein